MRWLLLVLVLWLAAGCGGSFWTPVRLAPSNPLQGQRSFVVEPIHYEGMVVDKKPEAEWLATKSPAQVDSWQADKADASAVFSRFLAEKAAPLQVIPGAASSAAAFVIRPICTSILVGSLNEVNAPTEMRLTIQVLDDKGGVIDEITSAIAVAAQLWNPASGGRLRSAGKFHGTQTADFLHSFTGL